LTTLIFGTFKNTLLTTLGNAYSNELFDDILRFKELLEHISL